MSSRKQEIYCEILGLGIMHLRSLFSAAKLELKGATEQSLLDLQKTLQQGFDGANFLHNIHLTVLEPDYVEMDLSFINLAFPIYINRLGETIPPQLVELMLEFYDLVPTHLRSQLSWHPSLQFRSYASFNK